MMTRCPACQTSPLVPETRIGVIAVCGNCATSLADEAGAWRVARQHDTTILGAVDLEKLRRARQSVLQRKRV